MKKARHRDPISASGYNALVDAASTALPAVGGALDTLSGPDTGTANQFVDPNPLRMLRLIDYTSQGWSFVEQYSPDADGLYVDNPFGLSTETHKLKVIPPSDVTLHPDCVVVARRNPFHWDVFEVIAVFECEPGGSGMASESDCCDLPSIINICVVKADWAVTDIYFTRYNPTTGATECVVAAECAPACAAVWWCDGAGTVFSSPLGPKPDNAVRGPFPTREYAEQMCPDQSSDIPVCGDDIDPPPDTLYATVMAAAGMCGSSCQPGDWSGVVELNKTGIDTWTAAGYDDPCPGVTSAITLICIDGQYRLTWGNDTYAGTCPPPPGPPVSLAACDESPVDGTTTPFSLTFQMRACCVCDAPDPDAIVPIVITE